MSQRLFLFYGLLNRRRFTLLFIGFFFVSIGIFLTASASQTTVITAKQSLNRYWRTTYDILVRPTDARSAIEEQYGLVEANHLSGLWGGITFEQFEALKAIPGVEVGAPIAMIGYIGLRGSVGDFELPPEPGVYLIEETTQVDNGGSQSSVPQVSHTYYFFDQNPRIVPSNPELAYRYFDRLIVNDFRPTAMIGGGLTFPVFLAGVDPSQEAALVGLDRAIVEGQYLREDESLTSPVSIVNADGTDAMAVIGVPGLINKTTYINFTHHVEFKRVILPAGVTGLDDILARGGAGYLDTLPARSLSAPTEVDSHVIYGRILETIAPSSGFPEIIQGAGEAMRIPSALIYEETNPPTNYNGLTLTLQLAEPYNKSGQPQYRKEESRGFSVTGVWKTKGIFSIQSIPGSTDVNRVPLETYFPPTAILRYDEQDHLVNPPLELYPTLNPTGYIQPPPMFLTTLEAARALRGESAISAIRVRVALDHCPPAQPETCTLTDADQRKIEAIAIEIAKQTGLDVDIMVGSSPTRVLVHVPGIGYVEEQWIHKGVNLTYKWGIQTGNWLLLGILLLVGSLFTFDMAWAEVLSRRRVIALQKALGWRSRTVFTQIVGQVILIGVIAVITGTLIATVLIRLLGWESIPLNLLIALPVIVIVLCAVGSLLPAWSASRVPPVAELQRGGMQYSHRHTAIVSALWSYGWSEIRRRRVRSVLTGMGSALSASLLTLLLGVTLQQRGMLGGTLLGEFILVNIEGYHYAIVAIGLGLAFLSTFNGLLGSILERRREIGVLKAIGWRTVSVARLFILQGTLLGVIGGCVGAFLGVLAFLYFYQSASTGLAAAFALGIGAPALVGALAALYPARLAAQVPPAEAVRYE